MADKKVVVSILAKFGVKHAEKLSIQRSIEKLTKRIETDGVPEGLNDEQTAALKELGLGITKAEKGKEKEKAPSDKPKKKATVPDDVTDDGKARVYILKGVPDKDIPDRCENLTAETAKARNSKRKDERRWELDPNNGKIAGKPEPKSSSSKPVNMKQKAAGAAGGVKRKRGSGGVDAMRAAIESAGDKGIDRDKLIAAIEKVGSSRVTAVTYIADAQRIEKLLGFLIKVTPNDDGTKTITKLKSKKK